VQVLSIISLFCLKPEFLWKYNIKRQSAKQTKILKNNKKIKRNDLKKTFCFRKAVALKGEIS